MKTINTITGVIVLLFIYCGCSKPAHIHAGGPIDQLSPLVREVLLSDTISRSFTATLKLDDVTGTAFFYMSGARSGYFSYEADKDAVLRALSRLPFPLQDVTADVGYHYVGIEEWETIRRTVAQAEREGAADFWLAPLNVYDIYASAKNDHHLLLVERDGRRILHRIASRS
jgi:hypothetical protein